MPTEDMDAGNFQCARQCGGQPGSVPRSLSQVCIDACCIKVRDGPAGGYPESLRINGQPNIGTICLVRSEKEGRWWAPANVGCVISLHKRGWVHLQCQSQACALGTPHYLILIQNTPKHHLLTQNTTQKKIGTFEKFTIFCPMMGGIAKRWVFFPNEAFLVVKSALGPHGANPPHIHMHMKKIFPKNQNQACP